MLFNFVISTKVVLTAWSVLIEVGTWGDGPVLQSSRVAHPLFYLGFACDLDKIVSNGEDVSFEELRAVPRASSSGL